MFVFSIPYSGPKRRFRVPARRLTYMLIGWLRTGFWVFFLLSVTTGCLEVKEEIAFKKNFSGQLRYTFDLSRLNTLLSLLGGGEQATEVGRWLADLNTGLKSQADKLKNMPGINQVSFSGDDKSLTYRLTFRFKNLDALNRALSEYNQVGNHSRFELSPDRKTLTKHIGLPTNGKLQEWKVQMEASDSTRQLFEMLKIFMKDAQFTSSWKFAQPVVNQTLDLGSSKTEKGSFTATVPFLGMLEAGKEVKISATIK